MTLKALDVGTYKYDLAHPHAVSSAGADGFEEGLRHAAGDDHSRE
jgi:hypothetical protein